MSVHALATVVSENAIRFLGHDTHEHDEPHLIYVVSGSAQLVVDGQALTLRRRESVWLAPHVPHSVRLGEGGMALGPLLDPADAPAQRVRLLGVVPALVDVMTTVLGAAPASAEQIAPFRAALGSILRRVGRQYFPVTLPTHPVAAGLARDAMRTGATLERLAERHRMSPRQVQRVFLDETGLQFARWRTRARLNAAISVLLGGGDLTTAARAAGFATRAGLVRALSRETGARPHDLTADPAAALAMAAPEREGLGAPA
ncbi:helix-turn-helix domain-containing protein [Microbacterium sp. 18062]|uniref:helix-turn-helix transcriptional regulator n=1 Tax=Microbacterium sp. 18062 TaxID=2681410 RepID=UPI00135763E6|nr:helix-turn-helix domain-containing protein [Microbacterium sp. 18062]